MLLVSYSPHSLAFTPVLYHSSRARKASCCSSLAFPIPPFLSPVYHTHTPYHALSVTSRIRTCAHTVRTAHVVLYALTRRMFIGAGF